MTDLLKYKTPKQYFKDLDVRMKRAGVSQYMLAEESGFSPNEISRWRNAHVKSPRFDKILELEQAFYRLRQKKKQK